LPSASSPRLDDGSGGGERGASAAALEEWAVEGVETAARELVRYILTIYIYIYIYDAFRACETLRLPYQEGAQDDSWEHVLTAQLV
jgi:hypothetical protein